MDLALYQPDQPQNTGTLLRLGACMGVKVHIIDPCGFAFSERALKRSAMDYIDHVDLMRHMDWDHFNAWRQDNDKRLVLLTTKGATVYCDYDYSDNDILLLGQESKGAPDFVHAASSGRVVIPMRPELRSLNIAVAAAMVLGEGLRQTEHFKELK